MKTLASRRLSAPFVFGLLLRGAAGGAGQPGSSRSPRPRRRGRASRAGWTLAALALALLSGDALFCTPGLAAPSSNDPGVAPWSATAQPPLASWRERWEALFGAADFLPGPSAARAAAEPEQGFFGRPWNSAPAAPAGRGAWLAPASSAGTTRGAFTTFSSPGLIGPVTNTTYTYTGDYVVDSTDYPSNTLTSIGAGDSFTITNSLYIGFNHTGSFSQSGGSVTAQASGDGLGFILGTNPGSSGTYTLTGGTLSAGNAYVGRLGSGTVNHSAGSASFSNTLYVGPNAGGPGTYNLSGTGSLSAPVENIGAYNGSGRFVQSGGTNTTQDLYLAQIPGGQGTYLLSAGVLSASEAVQVDNGTFTQTGGSVTTSLLYLANGNASDVGAYVMSGGTLTVRSGSGPNLAVGVDGIGTFTQNGGTIFDAGMSFSNSLLLGSNPGSSGTYHLNGGTLTLFGVTGDEGQSTFDFNGGTLQAQADNGYFLFRLTTAQVRNGGAKIDTNGVNVTIPQVLVHSTVSNDNATDGGLTKLGSGTLTLTGANTYTGGTFVNGGTLAVSGNGTLGTAGGVLSANGGTLDLGGKSFSVGAVTVAGGTIQNGTLTGTSYNGQSGTISASLAGSSGLTKTTAGTLTLSGANTYTGGTFVNGGTLAVSGNGTLGTAGGVLSANGGTLDLGGKSFSVGAVTVAGGTIQNGTLTGTSYNGQSGTISASLAGSSGLTKLGEGTLMLTGANTYTGQTTVSQGTLAVTGGSIGVAGTRANLTVNLGSGGTPAGSSPTAPILTVSGDGTQLFFHRVFIGDTTAGSVAQSGGTLTTGTVLSLGTSGGNGTYNLSGGTFSTLETNVGDGGTGTFNNSGGTQSGISTLYLGLNGGTGTYNLGGNGTLQAYYGFVGYTGTGVFNQTGGTANLGLGGLYVGNDASGQGTYGLGTAGGNLAATLNSSGAVYVGYSGTGTFNAQVNGVLQTGSNPLYLGYNAGSTGTVNSVSGELHVGDGSTVGYAGTGIFNSTGGYEAVAGTLVLGHAAGSSGTYNLSGGGTLVAGQVTSQGGTSTFNFDDGKLIPTASRTDFFQGLTRANVRNGGMTVDTFGYNVTVAQPLLHSNIQGDNGTDGGLTKFNTGVLTLTGANTYTGSTRVFGGTLLVNNTSGSGTGSGQVTVGNGAVLGGGGTIGGNVVAQAGSTVAPGAASQFTTLTLTLAGTLTLQSNALLAIKIGGNTGSGMDQVFAGGGFTLAGNLQVTFPNGFTPALGQSFTILDNTGNGVNSGTFANALGSIYTTAGGLQFGVNYLSNADAGLVPNDVTLTYLGKAVPEPGTWACLLVGVGALAARQARRRGCPGRA